MLGAFGFCKAIAFYKWLYSTKVFIAPYDGNQRNSADRIRYRDCSASSLVFILFYNFAKLP